MTLYVLLAILILLKHQQGLRFSYVYIFLISSYTYYIKTSLFDMLRLAY